MALEIQVQEVLSRLPGLIILVIGDYFLDEYLWVDPTLTESSLETGLDAFQLVRKQRQPGAAGTVVSNLRALGVGKVMALGVCGTDGEGFELKRALDNMGVDTTSMIECAEIFTPTYSKPMLLQEAGIGQEMSRFDTKNRRPLPAAVEDEFTARLRRLVPEVHAVIIADQVQERNCGVIGDRVRQAIGRLSLEYEKVLFLADSRARIGEFSGVMAKPNENELASLFDIDPPPLRPLTERANDQAAYGAETSSQPAIRSPESIIPTRSFQELAAMGQELARRTGQVVFATCGVRGMLVCTVLEAVHVPGIKLSGPLDIVGAGDSATAGIVCGLLSGAAPVEAASLGNIVASITVQKLGTTGTASPGEVQARARDVVGVLAPQAITPEWEKRTVIGRGIEIVRSASPSPIHSAIFDFDGTLSLIREGWQDVMIPFMVRELAALETGEPIERLEGVVREFVFRLTGKQTIYQMIQLQEEIRKRGGKPLNPQIYKQQYHDLLWQQIRSRVSGLKDGAIGRGQMLVPGALDLLDALVKRGVQLYLASGTDLEYVQDEVRALGLETYFGERVYAALPEYQNFSKKMVIQQILRTHSLAGPDLAAFGDGYVEIENAREVGGRAVGAATDEKHPGQLDGWKRNRLIAAGADVIVADFTEAHQLLEWMVGT